MIKAAQFLLSIIKYPHNKYNLVATETVNHVNVTEQLQDLRDQHKLTIEQLTAEHELKLISATKTGKNTFCTSHYFILN